MKKYFEIPQVRVETLNPANSIMDEMLVSKNLNDDNVVVTYKITDTTSAEYGIWKGFGK